MMFGIRLRNAIPSVLVCWQCPADHLEIWGSTHARWQEILCPYVIYDLIFFCANWLILKVKNSFI